MNARKGRFSRDFLGTGNACVRMEEIPAREPPDSNELKNRILKASMEGSLEGLNTIRKLASGSPELFRILVRGALDDCLERLVEYEVLEGEVRRRLERLSKEPPREPASSLGD